jgi:aryl-alcohol dehydrogenase-like predicted oxidoreductase
MHAGGVIAGATKSGQLEANVNVAAWQPTPEIIAQIDAISPLPPNSNGQ